MKKLLKWILPMVIVAAAIPVFPSLKAEVEPVKVEAKKYDETIVLAAGELLTEPKVFDSGKNILLDLNGHPIRENFSGDKPAVLIIKNKTKVTIKNSKGEGDISSSGNKVRALIEVQDGELNIQEGKFVCTTKPVVSLQATKATDKSEFVLSGGNLWTVNAPVIKDDITAGNISVKVDGGRIKSDNDNAVHLKDDSSGTVKLEVKNGNITGKKTGIYTQNGVETVISDGNIVGQGKDGIIVDAGSKAVVDGGNIKGLWSGLFANDKSKIKINGCNFLGNKIGRAHV